MLSFEDFLTERNDSIDDLFFRLLKTVNTEDDQEKRICAAKEALKNLEASEEGFPIDSVLAKEVIRLAEDVLKERKALSGQSLEWDMSIMGSIVETAERILNNAGIQTCYPFFADDEVPCVNTNECHAKAAGKCPFCTQNSEDCADGDCAIHQDTLQILLQKYQKVFGEIIFPDDPGKGNRMYGERFMQIRLVGCTPMTVCAGELHLWISGKSPTRTLCFGESPRASSLA